MKVLYVTNVLPYPPRDGGKIRRHHLAKALAEEHELTMLGAAASDDALAEYRARCPGIRFIPLPHPPEAGPVRVAEATRQVTAAERFDVLHVAGFWQWPGEPALGAARVVLDAENVESHLLARLGALGADPGASAGPLAALEARAFRRADRVLACSDLDVERIRSMAPDTAVSVVPNGVDLEQFRPTPPPTGAPPVLLFPGTLCYAPNVDAVEHFARRILPLVRATLPEARFRMVGAHPAGAVVALARLPGVELCANVPDVRPYLAEADLVVVPLRAGSGTRLKILEALAAGRPVVTTPVGCEGLETADGVHLLVAEAPEQFSAAVVRLLAQPALRQELARRGRRLVEERYGWSAIGQRLLDVYRELGPCG